MHGWTGACKRHVSVYDSAYVHIFRFPNATKRSALQKVSILLTLFKCKWLARGICEISLSLILPKLIVMPLAVMIIIIGIIIAYTDTTCRHVNNKIEPSRIGTLGISDFSFPIFSFPDNCEISLNFNAP